MRLVKDTHGSGTLFDRLDGLTPRRRLPGRHRFKADLAFYDLDGHAVALKSYAASAERPAVPGAKRSVEREARALVQASGLDGVARLLAVSHERLAMTELPGRTLKDRADDPPPPEVFDRLDTLLDRLHAKGVAHGDLHRRDVLVDDDGAVSVVDFATSVLHDPTSTQPPGRRWRAAAALDRIAALRLRARAAGEDPDAAVRRSGLAGAGLWRTGRGLKRVLNFLRGRR